MRKWAVGVIAAAAVVAISGCAAGLIGGATGGDERTASRIAEDSAITDAVKARLFGDREVMAPNVRVKTYDGVVTLRGEVGTAAQSAAAGIIARSVRGVKDVRNNLRVQRSQ